MSRASSAASRALAAALLAVVALPAAAQLSQESLEARDRDERFLRRAAIVDSRQMSAAEGVTRPFKLTLQRAGREGHALWKNARGLLNGHLEGWTYEVAAYRLDRYLGLGMVPPTVERRFRDQAGSCQLWVTYWKSLAAIREARTLAPPAALAGFNRGVYLQRAFDNLIANVDRHPRNVLVTDDWRTILIDHSRAFRTGAEHTTRLIYAPDHADGPMPIKELPRAFVDRLRELDARRLRRVVRGYLTPEEQQAVLARRDLLLRAIDEQAVLYEPEPGPANGPDR